MGNFYDGIVLIDKNGGETSFDVVRNVRKILKIKKVGHAGTLDPFATGLLIVLLGQGTKLSPFIMAGEKTYRAVVRLGVETDTQDPTGRVVSTKTVPDFDPGYISEKASLFVGEIEQVPPIFSAVKIRGKRAYKLARQGIKVDLEKRKIRVHSLKIVSIDLPDVAMEIKCSSGTYIRSLAADLGRQLGTGAHLRALIRLSSGPFAVKDALKLDKSAPNDSNDIVKKGIISLSEALPRMIEIQVDDQMARKIRNGYQPEWGEVLRGGDQIDFYAGYMKLLKAMELVAIAKCETVLNGHKGWLKIKKVFN